MNIFAPSHISRFYHIKLRYVGFTSALVTKRFGRLRSLMTEPVRLVNTNEVFDRKSLVSWFRDSLKGMP
jgi:hypothetical protein